MLLLNTAPVRVESLRNPPWIPHNSSISLIVEVIHILLKRSKFTILPSNICLLFSFHVYSTPTGILQVENTVRHGCQAIITKTSNGCFWRQLQYSASTVFDIIVTVRYMVHWHKDGTSFKVKLVGIGKLSVGTTAVDASSLWTRFLFSYDIFQHFIFQRQDYEQHFHFLCVSDFEISDIVGGIWLRSDWAYRNYNLYRIRKTSCKQHK